MWLLRVADRLGAGSSADGQAAQFGRVTAHHVIFPARYADQRRAFLTHRRRGDIGIRAPGGRSRGATAIVP
jgi:hypothetical protein